MSRDRTLYVGYLPLLARHRAVVQLAVPLMMIAAAAIGYAAAATMNSPGRAVWDSAETATVTGVLRLDPVPFIETPDGPVMLVEQGKFGARDRAAAFDGRSVAASGATLQRGPVRLLELVGDDAAIRATDAADAAGRPAGTARRVAATGEILDAKCFAGAMKPAEGRSHKACAVLCIRGGIPAVFVGTTESGETVWAVVEPEARTGLLSDALLRRVGERISASFGLTSRNGLPTAAGFEIIP